MRIECHRDPSQETKVSADEMIRKHLNVVKDMRWSVTTCCAVQSKLELSTSTELRNKASRTHKTLKAIIQRFRIKADDLLDIDEEVSAV